MPSVGGMKNGKTSLFPSQLLNHSNENKGKKSQAHNDCYFNVLIESYAVQTKTFSDWRLRLGLCEGV